jgi:hypothetical protein
VVQNPEHGCSNCAATTEMIALQFKPPLHLATASNAVHNTSKPMPLPTPLTAV